MAAVWRRAIAATVLLILPAAVFAAGMSTQDRALLEAREAFVSGNGFNLSGYAEKVRGHVLEPYVAFWGLKLRLEQTSPEALRAFLARYEGTLLAEQLRRDWLQVLGKSGQWDLFRQEYPRLARSDFEVDGYALQERWRRNDPSVPTEIRILWKYPKALPSGCAPAVDAMLQSGEFTRGELRDRFRLLVQAGLLGEARRIAERMPADQAPAGHRIDAAAGAPARFLERTGVNPETAAGRELAIVALISLARNDPKEAFRFWNGRLKEAFPTEDRQFVWAILATYAARFHLSDALDWFMKAGDLLLTDEQLAWRVRIGLRQENWRDVKNTIERMSPSVRRESTWAYWLGRSLRALGAPDEGLEWLRPIAAGHDFYGRLAAEELGLALEIPPKAPAVTAEELAEVAALGGINRALVLYGLGLRTEALDEWRWVIQQGMNDRLLLAAAELARRNGIWDRAINTADLTVAVHDFTLRYPAPYGDLLQMQARAQGLDEPLVFGLVRQESRFLKDARSSAGAEGLMQVMPSTARVAAKTMGMKKFRVSHLCRPEVNAEIGAFYLRQMLDRFRGSTVLALAAYNAGPIRASKWRDIRPLEGAIYVETIPFSETRHYVKKVMANAVYYAALSGREQRSLKSRLGTVDAAAMQNRADE